MQAKLGSFEIPERLIGSITLGPGGEARIRGRAIKDTNRELISEGFRQLSVGQVLHIDVADKYGSRLKGAAEVKSIELKESSMDFQMKVDFAISLKLK